jgi:hypothetical protein
MTRITWTIERPHRYNLFVDGIEVGYNLSLNDFFILLKRYDV